MKTIMLSLNRLPELRMCSPTADPHSSLLTRKSQREQFSRDFYVWINDSKTQEDFPFLSWPKCGTSKRLDVIMDKLMKRATGIPRYFPVFDYCAPLLLLTRLDQDLVTEGLEIFAREIMSGYDPVLRKGLSLLRLHLSPDVKKFAVERVLPALCLFMQQSCDVFCESDMQGINLQREINFIECVRIIRRFPRGNEPATKMLTELKTDKFWISDSAKQLIKLALR